jgi:hypothetical protein
MDGDHVIVALILKSALATSREFISLTQRQVDPARRWRKKHLYVN